MVMLKYDQDDVNVFRCAGPRKRPAIRIITLVLAAWLLAVVGSQGAVYFLEYTRQGTQLAQYTFFNLPISYWLTGHFLPLWFILLCVVFNLWMDRHAGGTPDGALRFRVRGDTDKEK